MLITQLKAKETITSLTAGKKVFIINCHGCKEVRFPEKEAVELQKELSAEGKYRIACKVKVSSLPAIDEHRSYLMCKSAPAHMLTDAGVVLRSFFLREISPP